MKCKPACLAAGLALLATSCMVGPNYHTPKANVASHWSSTSDVANRPFGEAEIAWWRNFNDPVLNRLVETACRNNLSLQIAGVRVLETRARLAAPSAICFRNNRAFPGRSSTPSSTKIFSAKFPV